MRKKNPAFLVKTMCAPARFLLPLIVGMLISSGVMAASFPVTNTYDAGPGSLRQAILDVNAAGAGPHSIVFNVYGQITVSSNLPQITKNNVTIDGQNKIALNANQTGAWFFWVNADNVIIKNFRLQNTLAGCVLIEANHSNNTISNIDISSTTNNIDQLVYVNGSSTGLTLKNITCRTGVEGCNGAIYGRAFYFAGGTHTNLVMDSINVSTVNNATGCEAVVFRDASVNGLTLTNANISGFLNGIVLDNTGGPVETANNILLNKVSLDSLYSGVGLGFYSDFVNTNITIKNSTFDQDVIGTTDDGDYNIRFDNTTNGITMDSVTAKGTDIYTVWFNGTASNINIKHSSFDCAQGEGVTQVVRFEGTTNTVLFQNVTIDGDRPATADDGDYGLLFISATADVTLDSLTVNEFDVDGVYITGANTNFQITNSKFTANFDGIEFYNNVPRTNVDIINSLFSGAAGNRSGIVINAANATSDIDLTGDTVINNTLHGIWLYGGTPATDVMISGCVIHNNGGAGIYNADPDKVIYTNNSIYNNTSLGIDNVAGNCGYQNPATVPVLVSSTPLGGGQYTLVINLPANVPTGYTVDIYANDPATSASSGQYFVTSLTGLNSGSNTRTVTYNTGPGATGVGFWTATLRIPANNCGTSEFSDKLSIGIKAPACITNGIVAWYRADMGINGMTWGDISGNANHLQAFGDPDDTTGLVNFNKAFYYDGNDDHRAPATAGVTTAYTMMGLGKLEGSQNARVFTSTTGNKLFGWHGGYQDRLFIEGWINPNTNPLTNYTKLYSLKRANTGGGPYEFKGNGILLNSGASSNGTVWTLDVGAVNGAEASKVFVPEVFIYNRDLIPAEIQRLESYMALKYGITLNNGATDYIASDGTTVMWSASTNNAYGKHITGIGKDDCTMLHQKQSVSADTGVVTIALGNTVAISNAANTNAVTTDKTFLVFGDNNAAVTYATAVTGTNVTQRMARVFKVQKSATWADQNITLQVKGAGINNYLLISTDPAFATISQELKLDASGSVTLNSSLLANGIYFTIGANIKGPGNVNAGIAMWLRADDGSATGAVWNDFSGSGNGALQAAAARQPVVNASIINYQPALKFNGTTSTMAAPSLFTNGTANIAIFAVSTTDVVQASSLFVEYLSPAGTYNNAVNAHVPYSDGILYWDAPYGYRMTAPWGGTVTNPYLWSFTRSLTNQSMYRNARTLASVNGAYSNITGNNRQFTIGAWSDGTAGYFNGKIAELIVYNNAAAMTATDRQKVQSYLAIKYGITMDQTTATNYLASDGTVYWNATANSTYSKHITGIGRDSITALNQKQSLSVDTGYVTMALGNSIAASNVGNTNTITTNNSYFVIGDNGAPKLFSTTVSGLAGVNIALARVWKVQKTNWADQNITLATDSTLPAPQYLIISTDATFGAGDLVLPVTNRSITLNTSQLPDGTFFTFGNAFKAPGNVTAGIAAWWRADVDAAAASWNDYSGNGKTLTQPTLANQPAVLPVNINFQPAVKFHPTASLNSASLFGTASTNNIAIFSVSAADGAGGNNTGSGLFSEYVSNGDRIAAWAPYGNGHVYFYPPLGWSVQSTTPLVAYANPRFNLYGFTKTPSQLNILFNNTTVGTANGAFTGINGNNQPFILGAFNGPDWFNGRIAEFVVYNNSVAMTATDRQKIQSYLALKYGITLNPAAPVDYLASDGTTSMWTAADNTGYGLHITGIGRDDSSALYQKQSRSIDTGIVAIGAGTAIAASNVANTTAITNNKSFFVFGDNGASAAYLTAITGITDVNIRMNRIFKVDKTNWADQDITLKLNGGNAQTYLLVSTDAIFGAGDAAYVLNADSTVTLNSSNLPDGAYFTFAITIKGPNAVNAGTVLWLRADDGTANGSQWKDFSGSGITATQPVVASQPATDAKLFNFNYGLKFDGGDYLQAPNNQINLTFPFGNTDRTLIAVSSKPTAALGTIFSYGNNVVGTGNGLYVTNTQALDYFGWGSDLAGPINTYKLNTPSIFTGRHSSAAGTNTFIDLNGINNASGAFTWNTNNTREFRVGIDPANTQLWPGNIAEIIVYNRLLNATELQGVNSYLSLKYGITMNGGTLNYLASDNTVYWTTDATYKSRVTGIGRDDSTALNTKQSLSADTGFVTLALGTGVPLTNEVNSNTITNNKSFLVFGDNGLSAGNFTVTVTGSANNVTRRMARVWKVQKTNWADQNITFKIKPIGIDNYLLISSDPTFATFSQEIPVASDGTVTFSSALFTGSDIYYTFGGPLKSPGGVAGHTLWVRADIGTSSSVNNTTISEWSDLSAFSNTFVQGTATSLPLFQNNTVNNINFNPVVRFGGAGYSMTGASILKGGTHNGAAVFAVNSQVAPLNSSVFNEMTANGTNVNLHATWGDNIVYWDAALTPNRTTYNAGNINNQVNIWTGSSDISLAANKQEIFKNGMSVATGNFAGTYTGNNSAPLLGSGYNGRLPEIILYTSPLTPVQRQRVNTYLALKYGITLNNGNTSYLATDGTTTVWDATANAAYKKNIAGIGRDDEEALQQKQSRSINAGMQVTIGLGSIDSTNTANPNSFSADRSYLVWGDDSTATTFRTATGFADAGFRMTRIWKVQETGTVGNVRVAIPANALSNPNKSYLIVSSDNVFDATDEYILLTPVVINGVNHLVATKDFTTSQFFTFATDLKVPGGVAAPVLWLRADFGTSSTVDATAINEWDDFGADINHATQLTAASQPLYRNIAGSNVNFNPVVTFNGTSHRMLLDGTKLPVGISARTVIALTGNAATANRGVISWGDQNAAGTGTRYTMEIGGGQRSIEASNSRYGNTGGNTLFPGITSFANAGNTTSAATQMRVNGAGVTNAFICCGTQTLNTLSLPTAYLGDNTVGGGGSFYGGLLGDIVVYDRTLTAVEQQRAESYLAIKYGITLNQTPATDYLATDGTVIWNATTNSAYKNSITGIGRDDLEGLNQKQSRNMDTTRLRVAIGLGAIAETNIDNTNTFAADKSYLIWGDDNAAATFKTAMAGNANVNYRMTRLWTVQETGTVGQVEVAFPYDALPNPRQSYLVVSADATIDNADTYIPLYDIMINGKRHWAAKTDFSTGQYFTVAAFIKSPGGVGATSLWVRADHGILNNTDGTPVDLWVDYGNEVNNASQLTAGIQPVFQNNATDNINYNPVVKFNGTSQFMNLDITKLPVGTTARTLIGVGELNNITGNRYIVSWGAAAASQGMGLANVGGTGYFVGYGNDVITAANFWQLNTPNELFGTWAGAGGAANLYSKITQVATPVAKAWNTGTTAGARIGNSAWGGEYWSGPISEVIAFDRELNNTERQRVTTYLAIRNGYTIDQSTPYSNYLNTNSTVIWDATANAVYKNNIAGIGRDDIEGLDQRQSKSINSGAILAIGLGTIATDNLANTNAFANDTAYFLWGSNATALTVSNTDLPAVFSQRLTQEWKVSSRNFNNQISPLALEFDLTGISHTGTSATDFTLLIDTDGDGNFTTGTIEQIPATSYAGSKASFNGITTLTNGAVFTVAIGAQSLRLTAKVILQGAWNGTAMRTDLKTASVLPATDPYGQNTTPFVSPNATAAQVVDWVLVELRDSTNPATVVASRAALVLSNGNIVDTGYGQPVAFPDVAAANYKVSVRHRNHLGVMSLNVVDFSTGVGTVDFTVAATTAYGTHARKDLGSGVMGLWAGNVNSDQSVRYSAKPSDASGVQSAVLTHPGNTTGAPGYTGFINAYSLFDVNLDGRVYYTAAPSDRDIIVNNVTTHPANVFGLAAYVIMQQLP